ncbi:MAG: ATP-binding cassette domain-containing protein [Acholeplasmataceae bacterium]|nr:ABC transporter A family member [Candidatus Izemoplasmatales bacterium]NLF48474.1 ATP-binding cassette domain-containing protein [Acholeplasmataceae bacterium]
MEAIILEDLTKKYRERVAVDHLSMTINEGELLALLGFNGAGKTTTIKLLSGLATPTEGNAWILGKSILTAMEEIKKSLNISPQETAIAPNLTVNENLVFIAEVYGVTREVARQKAEDMMVRFNMLDRKKEKAKKLSGGLKRRLSIAMALISEPKVLFLDEPTLGLDVRARRDLWKIILELKGKVTILLTSHYLDEVEALADRIAILDKGKLKLMGSLAELKLKTQMTSLEEIFLSETEGEVVQ